MFDEVLQNSFRTQWCALPTWCPQYSLKWVTVTLNYVYDDDGNGNNVQIRYPNRIIKQKTFGTESSNSNPDPYSLANMELNGIAKLNGLKDGPL
jgi:hypothetical protein